AGGRGTITLLQAGRAGAAVAVVAYHAAIATRDFAEALPAAAFALFERGTFGVDFFFVLSGFIIVHAHADDSRGAGPARAYAAKRLSRIYLPYLPVSLAMIALYAGLPGISGASRDWSLTTSLTLLPTGSPPALAAAWTLVHEMMFYALFLVSYFVRGFPWIVAAWVGAILAGIGLGLQTAYAAPSLWSVLAPINAEFVAGMGAALAVRAFSPARSPALAWPCLAA
ncbi:acyltransferase family protein, partial [Methylobacterium trifolii]